jgi:DnaJ family protein C protein 8
VDAAFSLFLEEVDSLKSSHSTKLAGELGTGEAQVQRLTSKIFSSAYEVLLLGHDADEKTIRNQYRKLSALVHPDKCKHPKANEAFHILKKALDDLMDPNYQDKYKEIMPIARERVYKRRRAENPDRMRRGEDPLELEGTDFEKAVLEECELIMKQEAEEMEYADKVRRSNEERLEENRKRRIAERDAERKRQKQWERTREQRVAGWRSFQENVEGGHLKVSTIKTAIPPKGHPSKIGH